MISPFPLIAAELLIDMGLKKDAPSLRQIDTRDRLYTLESRGSDRCFAAKPQIGKAALERLMEYSKSRGAIPVSISQQDGTSMLKWRVA